MQVCNEDIARMKYIVRRLTPTECERLMGMPDGYTIPRFREITGELVDEFIGVFAEWDRITGDGKPKKAKTAKQVRAWLEKISNPDTCPDAPRYKACGNGWATNQPRWILFRLLDHIDPDWMDDALDYFADGVNGIGGDDVPMSTNSNGDDVAPTISACEYKMGQRQKDDGGGYVVSRSAST